MSSDASHDRLERAHDLLIGHVAKLTSSSE